MPSPIHGSPLADNRSPRLLLVSYHFPPALTAGALRWQKLLPLLADRGWACDVLTLDPALLPNPDWERLAELPSTTRVFGVKPGLSLVERLDAWRSRAPQRNSQSTAGANGAASGPSTNVAESLAPEEIVWALSRKGIKRLYGTLLVHSRETAWGDACERVGRALVDDNRYAVVVSSGPPHGSHLAAARLARRARAPLVTDFRDPWSVSRRLPDAYASPLYFTLARRDEREALRASDLALATTDPIAESLRAAGARCPVLTVMNGNDDESHRSPKRDRFVIAYAGALYLDRDPRSVFRAVAELVRETGATPAELEVRLIGPVSQYGGRSTAELAAEAGVGAYVRLEAPVPRRALAERLAEASVLVSFPQDSLFAVPSKLFEYMAFEAWMLVLSAPGTPSATLMEGTDAAVITPGPGDVAKIRDALGRWFAAFRAGERPGHFPQRERFSRRTQANVLANALEPFRRTFPR